MRIWDAETGEPALEEILEGQGMNNVKDLHFSDDGSLLALACFDGYVRVVETQDWSIVSTYESRTEHNNVHISMATIMSVCFSPDKKYLYAILGSSNLVKAWDVATGAVAHIYDELYDPYSSASMSSIAVSWDSRYLYSSTDEGTLIKWKNPFFVSVPVKKEESFQVFPNPAGGYICITGIDTIEVMQIYDAGGKLVSEINNPNPEYISLEGIGSGSYYLKIKANSKTEECNLKIIK